MNKLKPKSISELDQLKIRIKKWEKEFYVKNGRKPTKSDINADNGIKNDYKKYWVSVEKSNMKQVWGKDLNKTNTTDNKVVNSQNCSVLNTFSKKMYNKFLKDSTTNCDKQTGEQFSFKKKLIQQRQQSLENQKNKQISEQQANKNGTSGTSSAISSEPKLNPMLIRAKSIDESILKSLTTEFNANVTKINSIVEEEEELISFCQPIVDNKLIDDIIERIEVTNDNNSNETIDSGVGGDSRSESSNNCSNDSLNELKANNLNTKRKSDVFDFDEDFEDITDDRPVKKRIYKDLDTDWEPNNTKFDSNSTEFNTNDSESQSIVEQKKKNKFFVSKDRTKRLSSLNGYKITMNSIIETEELNVSKTVTTVTKQTADKTVDNSEPEESVTKKVVKKSKTSAVKTTKIRPKKVQNNYKRLDLQKKHFASRGYKKFNVKKYKRMKWKQNVHKNRNNCYKCGAEGHWAQNCQFEDKLDSDVFEDELKTHGVSKAIEDLHQTLQIRPLIDEECEEQVEQISISDALITMGHKTFRDNQELAMKRILSGKSTLLVASTGSGKSLCYQLPAYLYWKHRKAITLVISPLISLMEDQLTTFPKGLKAVCIHSGLSQTQRQSALDSLLSGESQVILLSPEAITGGNTCINLNALPPIGFVCIDEAHCLSEWSNNFRPSYLQLYRVLRDKLKIKTYLALTATATKKTSLIIARTLGLDPQSDIIGMTLVPDNLILSASRDSNKELALIDLLKSQRFNDLKSIIIYCTRREQTERLATLIRISFQEIRQTNPKTGKSRIVWDAQAYHAGKTAEERNRVQKRFIKGDLRVIVATIAFGMGINKPDIRAIIHYNLPKSFENYMQEIGRAGRDGLEAHCHLFLDSDGTDLFELQRHIFANSTDRKCLRKLIEKVFKPCKCRTIFSEDDNQSEDNQTVNVCKGHEIAFPIETTVLELDLKEETIMTLLTYLELDFCSEKVQLLAPINSMCTLLCYGNGSEQMSAVAKQNPIVGIALTLYQKNNSSQEVPTKLKFDLVEVCSMLGRPISDVRNELRQLEWQEFNGRKKRTNIRVMFTDLSFHLRSVGDLTEEQLNECLEFLYDLTQIQESSELSKLRNVYLTFREYSQNLCTNRINQNKCLQLKNQLNKYFNDEEIEQQNSDLSTDKFKQLFKSSHVYDLEQARRDVRDLLSIHGSQTLSSARVIARILQGIASPRFPADVWGKCRRFWRSDINIDFNELLKIANEELIKLKS